MRSRETKVNIAAEDARGRLACAHNHLLWLVFNEKEQFIRQSVGSHALLG